LPGSYLTSAETTRVINWRIIRITVANRVEQCYVKLFLSSRNCAVN
jgi:hypothetical protein